MLSCVVRDLAKRLEPVLQPLVGPDERLLAVGPLVADPGTVEEVSVRDEVANLFDPTILLGLGAHPGELGRQLFFGRAVLGDEGSRGRAMYDAVGAATAPLLAVTDNRLLIVERRTIPRGTGWLARLFGPHDEFADLMYAVPRRDVYAVAPAPAGVLRRGRFIVGFIDGSATAIVCAVPAHADQALAALGRTEDPHG